MTEIERALEVCSKLSLRTEMLEVFNWDERAMNSFLERVSKVLQIIEKQSSVKCASVEKILSLKFPLATSQQIGIIVRYTNLSDN